jgi:hypothetical protein
MFDPNLPPPFPIVEDDLVYVITGYNKINCLPDSRESSIQNLRKYLVRISGVSGIGVDNDNYRVILFSTAQEDNLIDINYSSSYPYTQKIATTGLNSKTENLIVKDYDLAWPYSGILYSTGLNARVGNNMEIQFTASTPAANKYGGVGGKYFSGIISTTGLNTKTENLIVRDFESIWPYSGIIYNTGLNARVGNNMEIQFTTGTPAANLYGGVGSKYFSGIISTTGLNARTENLIVRDFETSWPYSGVVYNTGLNAIIGNNMEIQFATGTPAANKYGRVGGKYVSGIVSTTGLNARTENLIVRDFESSWPYSGIIYNTGLNAVVGNNMEIQFSSGTPAADKFGRVGSKYFSGIISTTGLNARTENLIVRDFETTWPYSGVIYHTGLNAVVGNNMEIQFTTGTPAANKYGRAGGKYVSGIISTTGLNTKTTNNIALNFDSVWPHSGTIYNTGLNARAGNNIEIDFSSIRQPNMGAPYYSGTISTTGLNMIAGERIQYTISPTWPYPYIISTYALDHSIYTSKIMNSETWTIETDNLTIKSPKDIDLSKKISTKNTDYPIVDATTSKGYLVELTIGSIGIKSTGLSYIPPEILSIRPTGIEGNSITWNSYEIKLMNSAELGIFMFMSYLNTDGSISEPVFTGMPLISDNRSYDSGSSLENLFFESQPISIPGSSVAANGSFNLVEKIKPSKFIFRNIILPDTSTIIVAGSFGAWVSGFYSAPGKITGRTSGAVLTGVFTNRSGTNYTSSNGTVTPLTGGSTVSGTFIEGELVIITDCSVPNANGLYKIKSLGTYDGQLLITLEITNNITITTSPPSGVIYPVYKYYRPYHYYSFQGTYMSNGVSTNTAWSSSSINFNIPNLSSSVEILHRSLDLKFTTVT